MPGWIRKGTRNSLNKRKGQRRKSADRRTGDRRQGNELLITKLSAGSPPIADNTRYLVGGRPKGQHEVAVKIVKGVIAAEQSDKLLTDRRSGTDRRKKVRRSSKDRRKK